MSLLTLLTACNTGGTGAIHHTSDKADLAYVVSAASDALFVMDVSTLEAVGSVDTNARAGELNANHMAMVHPDGSKVYVIATNVGELVVVETDTLTVTGTIPVGDHATHGSFTSDGAQAWVVVEDEKAVAVVDSATDTVVATIVHESLEVPHNVRFSHDGNRAFVPSIAGNQITIIDTATYEVVDVLVPEGLEMGVCAGDPCGFADAQIDDEGMLYAAHIETGQLLVYDTNAQEVVGQVELGSQPWAAFVDVGGVSPASWMAPNFGDASISVIDRDSLAVTNVAEGGDSEAYGINYSALTPDKAYVMNRNHERISILDAVSGELDESIDVGGTTETSTTTPDGRYILLPLSSADALAVFDVESRSIVARFDDIGDYPWSVGMSAGQNYCH